MFSKISNWFEVKRLKFQLLLYENKLQGKPISVFIRQPNRSKTILEIYIERVLIDSRAKVLPSNQKSCLEFLARGDESPITGAGLQIIGTLFMEVENLERFDFYNLTFSYKVIKLNDGTIVDSNCFNYSDADVNFNLEAVLKKFALQCCVSLAKSYR